MAKIEKLIYTNERDEKIEFSHTSKYHTNTVTGLSDVRNAIYSINSMGQDGDTYLGSRIESRTIEIIGSINERNKELQKEMRRNMNHVLNPQHSATLTYEYGDFQRVIDCKVDNAPIFTRSAIFQDFTIQLRCLNPFWRNISKSRDDIATWLGDFEFPVELPILEGWEIGHRQPSLIVNVYNQGDVRAGIKAEFRAIGAVSNPQILNVNTQEYVKININMIAGDVVTLNTGYGEKGLTLNRGGIISDAFRYLDPDSVYLQLEVGDNLLRYDADGTLENFEITLYHDDLYLGV